MTSADQRPAWNLLTGTLTVYGLLGVTIVLGIFLMPFTMRHLGQANYGVWMLAASMTAYFQLLDLGYGSGLVRQITQADARGDDDEVNVVLSTAVVVYTVVGIVTLAATAALTVFVVPRFPKLTHDQVRTAQVVLAILGTRMAIAFPMGIFGAINTARQKFALTGSIAIVVALIQGAVTFFVLSAGYGVVPLVGATTAVGVTSFVAYAAAARYTFPGMRLSPSRFSFRHVRDVTSFSLYLFLISIAYHLATNIDNLVIGAYVGTAAIAVYTVAVRLSEYQRELCGKFTGFLFPLVVRFHETRDDEALRATLVDGTRIALALVACVTLGLIAFGRGLIHIWMGSGFDATVVPMYVLAARRRGHGRARTNGYHSARHGTSPDGRLCVNRRDRRQRRSEPRARPPVRTHRRRIGDGHSVRAHQPFRTHAGRLSRRGSAHSCVRVQRCSSHACRADTRCYHQRCVPARR